MSNERTLCPDCDSSDGLATYDDHTYCFACAIRKGYTPEIMKHEIEIAADIFNNLIVHYYSDLPNRKISEETCRKYNYGIGAFNGKSVQIANYYKKGKVTSQKLRYADKNFTSLGDTSCMTLFGSQLWGNGKRIVITEGEIDAMSVYQAMGDYPAVSIKYGANNAKKEVQKNLPYLSNFEHIVLMFDMDEPGQQAAIECAKILPVGKVSIASLPLKDANEMLVAGREAELVNAFWRAKPYRPEGILDSDELYTSIVSHKFTKDANYPWPQLNHLTHGIRKEELVMITAGTGIGKSTVTKSLCHSLINQGKRVGIIICEEKPRRTALDLIGLFRNERLHITQEYTDSPEFQAEYDKYIRDKAYIYDFNAVSNREEFFSAIQYLTAGFECDYVFVDDLTTVCLPSSNEDERKAIDTTINRLFRMAVELNVGIFTISQLHNLKSDTGHEDGAQVRLSHLRGSSTLKGKPNIIISIEKSGELSSNTRKLSVLKNRFSGDVDIADEIIYNTQTGHLDLFGVGY